MKERARPGDVIWDLDDLAATLAFFGEPIPEELKGKLPWAVAKALLVMRDGLVQWLASTPNLKGAGLYVIVTDVAEGHRIANRINAELVVLSTRKTKGESESVNTMTGERSLCGD